MIALTAAVLFVLFWRYVIWLWLLPTLFGRDSNGEGIANKWLWRHWKWYGLMNKTKIIVGFALGSEPNIESWALSIGCRCSADAPCLLLRLEQLLSNRD